MFSLSVHLAICKSFHSPACSSICLLLDQSLVLNVFIAFISVTTEQIFFIFGQCYHYSINFRKKIPELLSKAPGQSLGQ